VGDAARDAFEDRARGNMAAEVARLADPHGHLGALARWHTDAARR
jgi:hypothetical protein